MADILKTLKSGSSAIHPIIRDYKPTHKTKEEFIDEIDDYLSHSRLLFLDEPLKEKASLCVDGTLSIDKKSGVILSYLW